MIDRPDCPARGCEACAAGPGAPPRGRRLAVGLVWGLAWAFAPGAAAGAGMAAAAEAAPARHDVRAEAGAHEGEIAGRVFMLREGRREVLAWALVELRDVGGEVVEAKISARDGRFRFTGVADGRYVVALGGGLRSLAEAQDVTVGQEQRRHADIDIVSPMRVVASSRPAPRGASPVEAPAAEPASPAPPAAPAQAVRGAAAQLGAFGERANAEQHLHALMARGLLADSEADIVAAERGERVLHRVLATPRRGSAAALCRALTAQGEHCVVVRR